MHALIFIGPIKVPTISVNASRFPNESPYNVVKLICIASLPTDVLVPLKFSWKRRMDTSIYHLESFNYNETRSVLNMTTNQSVIIVQENVSRIYRYRCRVELDMEGLGDTHKTSDHLIDVTCKCIIRHS